MDMNDFSLRLAMLREKKGVSARDMSLSMGQCPGYINNIESGKAMPSLNGLYYICEYLGITPSEFFDTETTDPAKISDIVRDLKKLNSEQLESVATIIKALLKS